MTKYYTKCGREFEKSSKSVVTGYQVPVMFGPDKPPEGEVYSGCEKCPFLIDVKEGWGEDAKHKRFECRAGSEPPNHTNEYIGSAEDKNSLHIYSLDHDFMERVIAFAKEYPELGAGYNADSMADCRRTVSVSCSQNKKGMAAKQELIDKFFPGTPSAPDPDVDPDDAAAAAAPKICGNCYHRLGGTCSEESQPRMRVKYDDPGCEEYLYDSSKEAPAASGRSAFENQPEMEHPSEDPESPDSPPIVKPIVPDLPPAAKAEQLSGFDYDSLDEPTADTLHMCESRIARIKMQTVYDLGQHLKIANDALANHGTGTFGVWCESIGFSRQSAQNYMQAYEFIRQNFDKPEQAVGIQSSLLFAAAKPSAPAELAQAVVDGDITKHKDYIAAMEQLRKVENLAEERRHSINAMQEIANRRSSLEQHLREQIDHANSEASKAYRQAKEVERQLEQAKRNGDPEKLAELGDLIREKQEEIDTYRKTISDMQIQLNSRPIEVKAAEVKEVIPEKMGVAWTRRIYDSMLFLAELKESDIDLLGRIDVQSGYDYSDASVYDALAEKIIENMQDLRNTLEAYWAKEGA